MQVALHLQHLYEYLLENKFVRNLDTVDKKCLRIHSDQVIKQIQNGEAEWENLVPAQVVTMIKEQGLFNWQA